MKKNALYIQSGGPTAVINSSAYGVICECKKHPEEIGRLFASEHGVLGVINGRLFDCSFEIEQECELLKKTPSMAFGSCRYQVADEVINDKDYQKILDTLKKFQIYYIFINGGNGSVRAGLKLYQFLKKQNYEFQLVVIPKTVDNDIYKIDHAPGFPSAARHVITGISELVQDMHTYDTDLIMFVEVMGRNTGFLAAASLAARETGWGPDLIYVPEVIFDEEKFVSDIQNVLEKQGKCFAVVAEGVKTADGKYLFERTTVNKAADPQLNMGGITPYLSALLRKNFTCKIRGIDMGLMQRCAVRDASPIDVEEAVRLGEKAVLGALEGITGKMVAVERISDSPYETKFIYFDLEQITEADNTLPREYLTEGKNNIKRSYLNYILPLVGDLPKYASLSKKLANPDEQLEE